MSNNSGILDQYLNNIKTFQNSLPVNFWFDKYFQCLFALTRVYDVKDKKCSSSTYCFITSLTTIVPNSTWRAEFYKFISMQSEVKNMLFQLQELKGFFNVYGNLSQIIYNSPQDLLGYCLQNNDTMFMYVYIMYVYMLVKRNIYGTYIAIPSYNEIRSRYNPDNLTKADWGRPTWYVIHTSALYMSTNIDETSFKNYRQFLECLRDILPCVVCKAHLTENLQYISLDSCRRNNIDLFRCTYNLHNIVNRSLNKSEPSFNEAISYYIPNLIRAYHKNY